MANEVGDPLAPGGGYVNPQDLQDAVEANRKKVVGSPTSGKKKPKVGPGANDLNDTLTPHPTVAAAPADDPNARAVAQPPEVEQLLGRPVLNGDIPKLMNSWNALNAKNPGLQIKDEKDTLTTLSQALKAQDPTAINAVRLSGEVNNQITLQLDPRYGSRQISVNVTDATAMSKLWETEMTHLPTLAGLAQQEGLGPNGLPLLLAAMTAADSAKGTEGKTPGQQAADSVRGITSGLFGGPTTASDMAQKLSEYMGIYHDETLALIASQNPDLAAKMIQPDAMSSMSSADRSELQGILGRTQWLTGMDQLGIGYDPVKTNFIKGLQAGGASGAGGSSIQLPDPAALRTSIQTLFKAWFQRAPSEGELADFAEKVNGGLASIQTRSVMGPDGQITNPLNPAFARTATGATPNYTPSPSDELQQQMKGTPEYNYLFGKMPQNMDETAYAQQNVDEAKQAFGAAGASNSDAIRAGMSSGQYGTTGRYLEGTPEALTNSHFQQNLADIARAVAAMT